jgi:hypothetical protein
MTAHADRLDLARLEEHLAGPFGRHAGGWRRSVGDSDALSPTPCSRCVGGFVTKRDLVARFVANPLSSARNLNLRCMFARVDSLAWPSDRPSGPPDQELDRTGWFERRFPDLRRRGLEPRQAELKYPSVSKLCRFLMPR